MPLSVCIVIGVIIFIIAFKIVFPTESKKIGIMTKGHLNLFIRDRAQTPKGAEAIYTAAIEEAEETYANADDMVRQLSGRIQMTKENLKGLEKNKSELERKCEALVSNGDFENAEILAGQREAIIAQIETCKQTIEDTQPLLDDTMTIFHESKKKVEILKIRKDQVVERLKQSIEYNKMVDSVDELKRSSDVDKMVGYVDEGYKTSQEKLAGARASYNNRLETKVSRAVQVSNKATSSAYIEQLKMKYNKK